MNLPFLRRRSDTFDYEAERVCKACGNTFHGRYCNRCGEKVVEAKERSILAFLDSLLNAFTFLDGKFLRSLKLVVLHPGQLSRNISDGVQIRYMRMISLFFVASFFYFFFSVFDSYNSSLHTQMNRLGSHSDHVTALVQERIAKEAISFEDFKTRYESESTNLSKLLLILLALMMSIGSAVVNFSKKSYFFDHLLFSLEYYSFQILINLVVLANIFLWLIRLMHKVNVDISFLLSDNWFTAIGTISIMYFLIQSERNLFHQKWYRAVFKSLLMYMIIYESVFVYRVMLFYATMASI